MRMTKAKKERACTEMQMIIPTHRPAAVASYFREKLEENLNLPVIARMPKDFSPRTFKESAPGEAGSKPGFTGTNSVPTPTTGMSNPAPLTQRRSRHEFQG